jgi:hypothetical protein
MEESKKANKGRNARFRAFLCVQTHNVKNKAADVSETGVLVQHLVGFFVRAAHHWQLH